jgi:DNA-binding IclR family transcriptional regulator
MPGALEERRATAPGGRRPAERPETVRALERGLSLLELLMQKEPQTLSELARAAGLPKSTTHRIVGTLLRRGFLRETAAGLRLGIKTAWFTGTQGPIQDVLDRLRAVTGETANFGVLVDREIEFVARSLSTHSLRWGVEVGSRVPLHCSGMGKAVLAFRPDIRLRPDELVARTPKSIVDPRELRAERQRTRLRGYALDEEEFLLGVVCIAVPVRGRGGDVVGAVSVSGPSVRFDRSSAIRHVPLLQEAALEIGRLLGHDGRGANV